MRFVKQYGLVFLCSLFFLLPVQNGYAKEKENYFRWEQANQYGGEETILFPKSTDFRVLEDTATYPSVTKIIFEEGVERLDRCVFYPFPNLKEIVVPASMNFLDNALQYYDAGEFQENISFLEHLERIEVNVENPYYSSIDGVLYNRNQSRLLYYPSSKKDVVYAMPEFVTSLSDNAFFYNPYLKKLIIGTRFKELLPFYVTLPNLQEFAVEKDNLYYAVRNGILYNKDVTKLLLYPQGKRLKRYIIPSSVVEIEMDCFKNATIGTVVFPSGLEHCFEFTVNPFHNASIERYEITDNSYYETEDGVLYNKTKTKLIGWPSQKIAEHITFPSTLTSLDLNKNTIPTIHKTQQITIPKDLSFFSTEKDLDSLEMIELEEGNKSFTLDQGLLYNSTKTILELIPPKGKITTLIIPKQMKDVPNYSDFLHQMPSVTKIIVTGDGYHFPYSQFPNLASIELAKGNDKAKVEDGILYSSNKKRLIWYPQNKKGASFTVPSTVTQFQRNVLEEQNYLKEITLPKGLNFKNQSGRCFQNCKNLQKIMVSSANPYLTTKDGVLFNKDKTTLYSYPASKTTSAYQVPDTVVYFHLSAGNPYLKTLTIGKQFSYLYPYDREKDSLEGFLNLERIISEHNENHYISIDGILYKKEYSGLSLCIYPEAKRERSFTIMKEVSLINCTKVLANHKYLKEISSESPHFQIIDGTIVRITEE